MSQDFETNDPAPPTPTPSSETKKSGPRLKIPVPPDLPHDDPEHGSPHRRLSTMVGVNFLLLLVLIIMLGLVIRRQSQAPQATEGASATRPEDSKAVAAEVDRLKAETPARLEALNQKVEAAVKSEAFAPAPKVDAIDKKVGELTQAIDSLKASLSSRPAPTAASAPAETTSESPAMNQAVDLFKKGKYLEAKEAFARLQAVAPDDARVWYFSALANGLATRDWKGESERLVTAGIEKEKAGSPDKAKIDAAFADLTTNTGKAWLSFYRSKAAQ